MATQEQVQAMVQEMNTLRQEMQRQRQEQLTELERVRAENAQRLQEVTQAGAQRVQEMAQAAMAAQGTLPTVIREMGETLQNAVVEAVKGPKSKLCLVDTKGLGKPSTFSGETEQFLQWRHRLTSYICSVYADLREVLEWCEERDKSISSNELDAAFGASADEIDRVDGLEEKSRELASALQMVTQKEPFAIVINCGSNGLEAWRRLTILRQHLEREPC